jgi:hypothetical protein
MNRTQFNKAMKDLKNKALSIVRNSAPVRTGNLQNSVKLRDLSNGGFEVYIDTGQAPYAEATTGPWTHPRWGGRQNPNEGWDQEAADEFKRYAKLKLQSRQTKSKRSE